MPGQVLILEAAKSRDKECQETVPPITTTTTHLQLFPARFFATSERGTPRAEIGRPRIQKVV